MKKILFSIFLIGLFAFASYSTPLPDIVKQTGQPTESVQVIKVDQQVHAPLTTTYRSVLPAPDNPVVAQRINKDFLKTSMDVKYVVFNDPSIREKPFTLSTSKPPLTTDDRQLTIYDPDKSKSGGQLTIRDKL